MSEQPIAPANETLWYRAYWQALGTKFLFGCFAGLALLSAAFLVGLRYVIYGAVLAAMQEYARQMMENTVR